MSAVHHASAPLIVRESARNLMAKVRYPLRATLRVPWRTRGLLGRAKRDLRDRRVEKAILGPVRGRPQG